MAHYIGDEHPDPAILGQLQSYLQSPDSRYQALGTLWTDLPPGDRNALLSLNPNIALSVRGSYATHIFGRTYIVTANEGDGRDYDAFSDGARVDDLPLDPAAFPDADTLQRKDRLGRLKVTTQLGDTDGDGDYERLFTYGARSFSIFKVTREGLIPVFDSGDQFEQITAAALPEDFNSDNDVNDSFDSRSDAKGPEPEGIVIGTIGHHTYVFIGLERVGGIMVYDVTRPWAPQFVQYVNNRDFDGDAEAGTAGDLGPEGIAFIPATDSPDGQPMLAVANEVSGTTTLYSIENIGNKPIWCNR